MRIILFTHAPFVVSQSMPRFAAMLQESYQTRGHQVETWTAAARVVNLVPKGRLTKWAGYIDQYVLFPFELRARLRKQSRDSIYVFCDHALGPWMPHVTELPHVVHCHDFLALRSALGKIPENPTSLTGRIYQKYIRRGFKRARNFISISEQTRRDLTGAGQAIPAVSAVVYNGLNYPYQPLEKSESIDILRAAGLPAEPRGMILHVGGGQWYKNTRGVIEIYGEYARSHTDPLPLWIIGPAPKKAVQAAIAQLPPQAKVSFYRGLDSVTLQAIYSQARVFIFPSFDEGFGWPIVEALACGCAVITTGEAPMNEVGGTVARYLPRLQPTDDVRAWAAHGAALVEEVLSLDDATRREQMEAGLAWARRFDKDAAIEAYLQIYRQVLEAAPGKATDSIAVKRSKRQ